MAVRLGLMLSQSNARRLRRSEPDIRVALLERTLHDPPRAAAARRWASRLRRMLPEAELVPYAWHLVTHAPEDRLRARSARSLEGAPYRFGLLQDTREVEQAWDATRQTASALGARRIALRTPPGLAPGPLGRRRLQDFVARRAAEGVQLLWEPQGLWTPTEADSAASALGLTLLLDAFDEPVPGAWLRVDPMRRGARLGFDQIDALIERIEAEPDAVLVFAGSAAIGNLVAVRDALE